uniref:Unclassified n=1 Tax=Fusarium pseudograminearum CS3427 TaxID=1318457 RepID=W1IBC0_FUSPS|nr:unclassified [Fusarium pseudograminearum CS3427]CDX48419.1 unclassified [Fusarium pseudograminearum CS3427]
MISSQCWELKSKSFGNNKEYFFLSAISSLNFGQKKVSTRSIRDPYKYRQQVFSHNV